jgi:hypothetical protein
MGFAPLRTLSTYSAERIHKSDTLGP